MRSEHYSMDSVEVKMLRKVDVMACFLQLLVKFWSEIWWWMLLCGSPFSWRLAGEKAVSDSLQDLPASSILWTYFPPLHLMLHGYYPTSYQTEEKRSRTDQIQLAFRFAVPFDLLNSIAFSCGRICLSPIYHFLFLNIIKHIILVVWVNPGKGMLLVCTHFYKWASLFFNPGWLS